MWQWGLLSLWVGSISPLLWQSFPFISCVTALTSVTALKYWVLLSSCVSCTWRRNTTKYTLKIRHFTFSIFWNAVPYLPLVVPGFTCLFCCKWKTGRNYKMSECTVYIKLNFCKFCMCLLIWLSWLNNCTSFVLKLSTQKWLFYDLLQWILKEAKANESNVGDCLTLAKKSPQGKVLKKLHVNRHALFFW